MRDFRARGMLTLVVIDKDACVLCEGVIDRFDREHFHVVGHCCACRSALEATS